MNNTQSSFAKASAAQEQKPDPKGKAIASFVLGIINPIVAILAMRIFSLSVIPKPLAFLKPILLPIIPAIFLFFPISFVLGILFGIMGLKSTKRNFAVAGILLSVLSLLVVIFVILTILAIAGSH